MHNNPKQLSQFSNEKSLGFCILCVCQNCLNAFKVERNKISNKHSNWFMSWGRKNGKDFQIKADMCNCKFG